MKQLIALVWKEWREDRAFLWIGLGVFLGLPMIGGLEAMAQYSRRFEISASPWVLAFGGVLAVFVAVGATCRDFAGHLEEFWRSRPVGTTRWLMAKYLVGLAVVLVACIIPLAIEVSNGHDKSALLLITWFPFLWAALYGIAFLAGCVLRRTSYAAMLALAAMLLVYFLPVVFPPLHWLKVSAVTDVGVGPGIWPKVGGRPQWAFAAGMFTLAIVALLAALLAIHRDWQIRSGRKLMYASISAAFLLLLATVAFQVGTNIPVLCQVDLPKGEEVERIQCDGNAGYVITVLDRVWPYTGPNRCNFRALKLTDHGIELGSAVPVPDRFPRAFYIWAWWMMERADVPGLANALYYIDVTGNDETVAYWLNVAQLDKGISKPLLQIWEDNRPYNERPSPRLYGTGNRLYVMGDRLMTLDVTQPLAPRVIADVPFGYDWWGPMSYVGDATIIELLPPVPNLSPMERLRLVMWRFSFDGEITCQWLWHDNVLVAYRLTQLADATVAQFTNGFSGHRPPATLLKNAAAVFTKIGQYKPNVVEEMFTSYPLELKLQNGRLYVTVAQPLEAENPHIDVFDVRGPHPLRLVGHFAAPGIRTVCPLPDGRALVGGPSLWLIGPPPHYRAD